MYLRGKLYSLTLAALAACLLSPTETGAGAASTTSSSGRFVITGGDAVRRAEYSQWAEGMADRIEEICGFRLPRKPAPPLEIRLEDPAVGEPAARPAGTGQEGRGRGIVVNEHQPVSYDDLADAFCVMVLTCYVESRREVLGPHVAAQVVPQWLSTGLARNLDMSAKMRNRKLMKTGFSGEKRPPASAVLQWDELPAGWNRDRALCGMVAAWVATLKGGDAVKDMCDRLAQGGMLTVEWMATQIAGAGSVDEMDRAWSLWIERQDRLVQEFGELSSIALEELKSETVVSPISSGATPRGPGRTGYTARELIDAASKSPALRVLAGDRAQRIRALTVGKAPEIVEAGNLYVRFFDGVASGSWRMTLRARLSKADSAFDRLMDLTRAREAYLDAIENERGADSHAMVEPVLEKSRIESYVDDAERRWPSAAP